MENKEIISAQVVFPDGRTLDEVYASLTATINGLKTKVSKLEAAATATTAEEAAE